jgi:putative ABC transport system permease protein
MLNALIKNQVALGFAQAGLAALFALAVAAAAGRRGIRLKRETLVALARGLAQIVAVGAVLAALLRGPRWTSPFMLACMIAAAAGTSVRRTRDVPGVFRLSLYSIALGAGSMIALFALLGVIDTAVTSLIPVGSMLIANAMNGNAIALERFRADVRAHVGEIETALSLGAPAAATVAPYAQAGLMASLIPSINNLRSLGIVWIPGLMAGMVLSGSSPVYASIYQFVVLAGILASSGLTCLISTSLMANRAFSPAEQLLLR